MSKDNSTRQKVPKGAETCRYWKVLKGTEKYGRVRESTTGAKRSGNLLRGMGWRRKFLKGTVRYVKRPKCAERYWKARKGTEKYGRVQKGVQWCLKVRKDAENY